MTEAPLIAIDLDPASETMNYKQIEKGITVIFAPAMLDDNRKKMSRRNYRRTVLNKARKIGIEISYDDFMKKPVTDQFLFLRKYIPDGWQPLEINPWYADAPNITTPIGKFEWPERVDPVIYKLDKDGNKVPMDIEHGQFYILDESGVRVPVDQEVREAAHRMNLEIGVPQVYDLENDVMLTDIDDPRFNRGGNRIEGVTMVTHEIGKPDEPIPYDPNFDIADGEH